MVANLVDMSLSIWLSFTSHPPDVFLFFTTSLGLSPTIMPPARNTRGTQPTSLGLGLHFVSPKKSRDLKKTQSFIHIPGVDAKHKRLLDQMAALMNPPVPDTENPSSSSAPPQSEAPMSIDNC
ncbi:hypothetical protein DFH29DRAFT_1006072 [Suillus ampliporus]|nr:hypothetical protein DFH29DRAFT_1006072 [Suillus ampliporus]